jgi:putative SOS response-associated peptidase YedK
LREQWWGTDKASDEPLKSCTLITTDANELAAKVHDRMPVNLDLPDYDAWLDPANHDVGYMLDQIPADRMSVRPVSTFGNNARNEGAECVGPMNSI